MPKKALTAIQTPRIDIYAPGNTEKADLLLEMLDEYGMKLFPWQRLVLKRWLAEDDDGNFVNLKCGLSVPRQNGKLLAESTEIPTPNGWTTIGEVKVGDYIFGDDGKPTKVLAKYEPEEENFYEIDFGNAGNYVNETIKAGGGHLWELQCKDWSKPNVKDTNWIYNNFDRVKQSKRAFSVKLSKPVEYHEKDLPIDPYALGLWLGDGTSRSSDITCDVDDLAHYQKAFEETGGTLIRPYWKKGYRGITFKPLKIKEKLADLGLIGNKHIPHEYMTASRMQRLELLRGLMDSDGHAEKQSAQVSFSQSGRPEFIEQVMELICSLGMKPSIKYYNLSKKNPNHKDAQVIYFSVIGDPVFKMPRKQAQFEKYYTKKQRFNAWYIKDIRKIEKTERYYCLAVDNESHLFLCGRSYIPTHNTELIVARIIYGIIFRRAIGLFTAQQVKTAKVVIRRVQDFFYESHYEEIFNLLTPRFRKKPRDYDFIEFENGSMYQFITRSRMGGLGTTNDELICDEAADMLDSHQSTLLPTISAAKTGNPQVIYSGTPPMPETVGAVFGRVRKEIMAGDKGAWTEWSVENMTKKTDEKAWYATNPSLGKVLIKSAIEAECGSLSDGDFNRMRLGWWCGLESKRAIEQKLWDECGNEKPEFDDSFLPVYAVKFAPDRSNYSLAVAQPLTDGRVHCEIVKSRPMDDGWARLSQWLINRHQDCARIIIDGATGQSILFEEITRAGVPAKKIVMPNVREVVAAHQFIYDAILRAEFSHYKQPLLDQTVRITDKRPIGRYGGFGWDSMSKHMTTCALDAVTFAYWGQKVFSKQKKSKKSVEENNQKWKEVLSNL